MLKEVLPTSEYLQTHVNKWIFKKKQVSRHPLTVRICSPLHDFIKYDITSMHHCKQWNRHNPWKHECIDCNSTGHLQANYPKTDSII